MRLKAQLAHLEQENKSLSISRWFGCLNRNGLDKALAKLDLTDTWLLFLDVDYLKALNNRLGKPQAGALIKACIKPRSGDIIGTFGQWFSGDEFAGVFWSKADAIGYAQRTQMRMHAYGISATFVILPTSYRVTPHVTLDYADALCNYVKQELKKRDLIIVLG